MNTVARLFYKYNDLLAQFAYSHLRQIALIFAATLLAIFGSNINNAFKRLMGQRHFLFRVLAFIALCSAGYALLTLVLSKALFAILLGVPRGFRALVIAGMFFLVGLLAEQKSHI